METKIEQFNPKLHCRICYLKEKRGIVKWHRFNAEQGVYVCRFGHKLRPDELTTGIHSKEKEERKE